MSSMIFSPNFFHTKLSYENISLAKSIIICFLMASFYVISLYLWSKQNRYNRNDPSVIKRRFISVIITCFVCFIAIYLIADKRDPLGAPNRNSHCINEWVGFRFDFTLIKSSLTSILLTAVLFGGPLIQYFISEFILGLNLKFYDYYDSNEDIKKYGVKPTNRNLVRKFQQEFKAYLELANDNLKDLCFWRNYIVSPFTEEFVFRSCMLPLLVQNLSLFNSIFVAPLFFGLAHLHHIIEGYILNEMPLRIIVGQHLFQFSYTYIFGVYSSYLFLKTGSFFSSFLSHAFCNFLGFPNLRQLFNDFNFGVKYLIVAAYFLGLLTFFLIIPTLTEPGLFDNQTFVF